MRKYNLKHDFSNPVWITCTRDITLEPPPPPEKVPLWKTIRPKKKHVLPTDEPLRKTFMCFKINSRIENFHLKLAQLLNQTNGLNLNLLISVTKPNQQYQRNF